uniref:C-type lectin domain-containing protein n=1 Tax=Cyprinodon variegatus TaxID=28743 RepID=A0A3Q2DML6_CYPVA
CGHKNLFLCTFLGWLILSLCLEHQYYFVENKLTWYQAQSYCRQHYTDLATIRNSEDMNHFLDVLSSQSSSDVWIGLYSEINWMWSNELKKRNPGYINWETSDYDPDFISANQFCVCMGDNGKWWDYNCEAKFPFLCFLPFSPSLNQGYL